jgi:FkbM family methyltransferase
MNHLLEEARNIAAGAPWTGAGLLPVRQDRCETRGSACTEPSPSPDWTLDRPDGSRLRVAPSFACPHTRAVLVLEDEADEQAALWPLLALADGPLVDLAPEPGWATLAWAAAAPCRVWLHEANPAVRHRVVATLALNGHQDAVSWLDVPVPATAEGAVVRATVAGHADVLGPALAPWLARGACALALQGLRDAALPRLAALVPAGWRCWRLCAAAGVLLPHDTACQRLSGDQALVLLSPEMAERFARADALFDPMAGPAQGPRARHAQGLLAALQALDAAARPATVDAAVDADAQRVLLLQALGLVAEASELGRRVLARCPAGPIAALRLGSASSLAGVEPSVLRQSLLEFVLHRSPQTTPDEWTAALADPAHSACAERAALMAHMAAETPPSAALPARLRYVPAACANVTLWSALLDSARELAARPPGLQRSAPDSPEQLLAELGDPIVQVVDVGASSLGGGTEPYATLADFCRVRVTGFEPDAQALAELQRAHQGVQERRYLPHFVGDGADAVFHETNWSLTGSLLAPNRQVLDRYPDLGSVTQELARHPVRTVRLDDVIPAGGMDLLKIDVQGGEGRVFNGARARLEECLLVWTEVEFLELYQGQPLFGDIDRMLRERGLRFFGFAGVAQRPLASWAASAATGSFLPAPRRFQQIWADAIYLPEPERIATLDADRALRLALISHHVLGAWDLCHEALQRHEAAGGTRGAAQAYRERMRSRTVVPA